MNIKETAIEIGIRLGKVVKYIDWRSTRRFLSPSANMGRIVEETNTITLSAGDANWNSAARQFAEAAQ